jgi:hypothetical protein
MNKLFVKLPLILGVIGAIAFAAPPSLAAAKKGDKAVAATTKPAKGKKAAKPAKGKKVAAAKPAKGKKVAAAKPAAKPADYPGSEMRKPPLKVSPIFPYTPEPPSKKK